MDRCTSRSPVPPVYHRNLFRIDPWSVRPGSSNCNLNSTSSISILSICKPTSNTSNMPSGSIQNGLMHKPASNNGVIPYQAMDASNSNNHICPYCFGPQGLRHKLTPSTPNLWSKKAFIRSYRRPDCSRPHIPLNNPTLDSVSIPKGWYNASPFLPYVCLSFDPEEYGLPPMKAILCDDMEMRYLLEASGIYYMYNDVSNTLWQIHRPTGLPNIVFALGYWKKIAMTEMDLLWANYGADEASDLLGNSH